ncbi:hypothetical protein CCP1ISM_290010 [Azospirillaceae bacterium]
MANIDFGSSGLLSTMSRAYPLNALTHYI